MEKAPKVSVKLEALSDIHVCMYSTLVISSPFILTKRLLALSLSAAHKVDCAPPADPSPIPQLAAGGDLQDSFNTNVKAAKTQCPGPTVPVASDAVLVTTEEAPKQNFGLFSIKEKKIHSMAYKLHRSPKAACPTAAYLHC